MAKIAFNGKEYESLAGCYKDNAAIALVTCATFTARIRRGFSVEKALTTPKLPTLVTRLGSHTIEGKVFKNLPSIAKEYGMKPMAIYKRYWRGFRGDDLVPLKKRKYYVPSPPLPSRYEIEVGGQKYPSARQACHELGINYSAYFKRRRKGWSIEQALGIDPAPPEPKRERRKFDAEVFGIRYRSLRSLAAAHSINYYALRHLVNSAGLSPEEAVKFAGRVKGDSKSSLKS